MFIHLLDILGTAVFAVSGVLAAGRKRMDISGVVVIAAVTAIGGGTLRDVLLGRHPIFWFHDPTYLYVILIASVATMLYTRYFRPPHRLLLLADAVGLATFVVLGANAASMAALPFVIVILLAVMTGVVGGVIRDVLCAEIPLVLQKDIYMLAALAGASVYVVLKMASWDNTLVTLLAMSTVIILRLAAIFWHLHLPRYQVRETPLKG
ncbi:trimeric intracellular cation channel family protein [Dictyobacter kobayashii]|uniref:Membrane protein n=1 Tax=Dictyobacter kobayashii TaxID=2014872 RepID=A0A402ASP7_9CHLR|nr:trimeric intracellular cation channel family protein [Dictyobacter kobayashii]GCE22125.1 membrane protein [Dictyobacter kobayashii]